MSLTVSPPYLTHYDSFHYYAFMKTDEDKPFLEVIPHLIRSNFWVRLLNAQLSALFCPHLCIAAFQTTKIWVLGTTGEEARRWCA